MGSDPIYRAAQLALVLTLAVVVAAAGIRHGVDSTLLRPVHRVAATLVVPVALWMAWKSFGPPTVLAVVLTAALSVVGIIGGKSPPPAIAAANLLGGLALAALFAWIAGKRGQDPFPPKLRADGKRVLTPFPLFLLLAVQVALGAWVTLSGGWRGLPLHGLLAMLLAALLGWAGLARLKGAPGRLLFAAAIATPLAGMTALQYERSPGAALVHAGAAAFLVCLLAWLGARRA